MGVRSEYLIAWGDCDSAGIVHFPRYFYFMDCAFTAMLRNAGLNHYILIEEFRARVPIIDVGATFLAPMAFDDRLVIDAEIAHWGNTSFLLNYKGSRNGVRAFEGYEARVWATITGDGTVTKRPVAPEFKAALTSASRSNS